MIRTMSETIHLWKRTIVVFTMFWSQKMGSKNKLVTVL